MKWGKRHAERGTAENPWGPKPTAEERWADLPDTTELHDATDEGLWASIRLLVTHPIRWFQR